MDSISVQLRFSRKNGNCEIVLNKRKAIRLHTQIILVSNCLLSVGRTAWQRFCQWGCMGEWAYYMRGRLWNSDNCEDARYSLLLMSFPRDTFQESPRLIISLILSAPWSIIVSRHTAVWLIVRYLCYSTEAWASSWLVRYWLTWRIPVPIHWPVLMIGFLGPLLALAVAEACHGTSHALQTVPQQCAMIFSLWPTSHD